MPNNSVKTLKKSPFKFENNKLIVFISCRVHPGETTSSYALKGILKFLLNKNDPRS